MDYAVLKALHLLTDLIHTRSYNVGTVIIPTPYVRKPSQSELRNFKAQS